MTNTLLIFVSILVAPLVPVGIPLSIDGNFLVNRNTTSG